MHEPRQSLKKFLDPGWTLIVGGCFLAAIFVASAVVIIVEGKFQWYVLAVAAFAALVLGVGIAERRSFSRLVADATLWPRAEADYAAAEPMQDGTLVLGEEFLFARRHGSLIRYDEIQMIYQTVRKAYGLFESGRALAVIRKGRKTAETLCALRRKGKDDGELLRITEFIRSKNPDVAVGFSRAIPAEPDEKR